VLVMEMRGGDGDGRKKEGEEDEEEEEEEEEEGRRDGRKEPAYFLSLIAHKYQ